MSTAEAPQHRYDPLTDEGGPRRKKKGLSTPVLVGIIISALVHLGLLAFVIKAKFEAKYEQQKEDVIKLEAPPPPPPPEPRSAPPPPVAPRITPPRPDLPPPPPLPIPPSPQPVKESPTPPQVVPPTPPAPPAPVAPAPPPVLSSADFIRKPGADEFAEYYPDVAQREGKGGRSTIKCVVTVKGSLTQCQILSETPSGYQFGAQAVKIARFFKIAPAKRDGQPVEGSITIPITWQLPQ